MSFMCRTVWCATVCRPDLIIPPLTVGIHGNPVNTCTQHTFNAQSVCYHTLGSVWWYWWRFLCFLSHLHLINLVRLLIWQMTWLILMYGIYVRTYIQIWTHVQCTRTSHQYSYSVTQVCVMVCFNVKVMWYTGLWRVCYIVFFTELCSLVHVILPLTRLLH